MQKGQNILKFFFKGLNSENYLSATNAARGRKNGWHQRRQYVISFECQNSGEMEEACENVSKSTCKLVSSCRRGLHSRTPTQDALSPDWVEHLSAMENVSDIIF